MIREIVCVTPLVRTNPCTAFRSCNLFITTEHTSHSSNLSHPVVTMLVVRGVSFFAAAAAAGGGGLLLLLPQPPAFFRISVSVATSFSCTSIFLEEITLQRGAPIMANLIC